MKLWVALALGLLIATGAGQESEGTAPPRKNPFLVDIEHFSGGPKSPLMLHSSDFDLSEMAAKVASAPPKYPPGGGVGIGGPVALLHVVMPPGQSESGFKISIYPRSADQESGLMGLYRVTALADHLTEERYLGFYDDKGLRSLCEAEGMRLLAEQAAEKPLQVFSMIGPKEGAAGVWVEKLYVANVGDQPLLIDKVSFQVLKAGTTEELRKVELTWPPKMKRIDGTRQFELLPRRTWLALSTEWNALPELTSQSCSAGMRINSGRGASFVIRAEVNRHIEAEIERP